MRYISQFEDVWITKCMIIIKSDIKTLLLRCEMMTEKQFKLTVQDNTNIEVKVNFTDVDSKGIIHIFHGMAEHMERYDKLAHGLSKDGFDVICHNHIIHGINIDESTRGHCSMTRSKRVI